MIFRLRHGTADSPPCPAESDSLSYGLPFRFQLLPTPFHNDAVTFRYGVMAYADRDFHPDDKLPLWAHGSIIGRMAGVGSELATYNWLRKQNALGELLEVDYESLPLMTMYRAADAL